MKHYTPEQCQKFIDSAKLLSHTKKQIKDIFNILTYMNRRKTACTYFDENGESHSFSYAAYRRMSFDCGAKLANLLSDCEKGSIVGLKLNNCPSWPLVFWGILMSGHKPLLIDFKASPEVTKGLLANADAKALIYNGDISDLGMPCLSVSEIMNSTRKENFFPTWENKVLFCSSGTTGNAKMFVYDGDSLCNQILEALSIPEQSVTLLRPGRTNLLSMIPYHHVFGFMVVFLWYNFYGKNIVYPYSINSKQIAYACQAGKCTHIYSVPLFWDNIAQLTERTLAQQSQKKQLRAGLMMDYNVGDITKKTAGLSATKIVRNMIQKKILGKHVEYAISGGGYLNPHSSTVINSLGYPLYNGYGMTELGITSVEQSSNTRDRLKFSIGKPFYGVTYKIDGDKPRGELLVKSAAMHKERLFEGKLYPAELTEDGFFRTGDIAEKDEDGRFYIRGREKDVIINSNGENIYPDELELFFKDMSHTANDVVLGVREEKDSPNETITLVLQLEKGTSEDDYDSIRKEFESINATLPSDRRIEKAYVTKKPLPMANGVKVKRYAVKKALESGKNKDYQNFDAVKNGRYAKKKKPTNLSRYSQTEVQKIRHNVIKIWSKILILDEERIKENSHFSRELGGDSMTYITMVQEINEAFQIIIPVDYYGLLLTPNDFVQTIIEMKNEKN